MRKDFDKCRYCGKYDTFYCSAHHISSGLLAFFCISGGLIGIAFSFYVIGIIDWYNFGGKEMYYAKIDYQKAESYYRRAVADGKVLLKVKEINKTKKRS